MDALALVLTDPNEYVALAVESLGTAVDTTGDW